jgi:membrane fusion protein (multidrug efflux system)
MLMPTHTFDAQVTVKNPKGRLRPGMVADVVMEGRVFYNAILVPQEAVIERLGDKVVYVVEDEHAIEKIVMVEGTSKGKALIGKGINPGDLVVIVGQKGLRHGLKVKVLKD